MFDSKYRVLDAQISAQWTPFTEIAFLKARLQLYSFACSDSSNFPKPSIPSGSGPLQPGISELLASANLVALRLIQIATSLSPAVPIWTSIVRSSIAYAVFFLLKLSSSPEHSFVDVSVAKNSISAAWNLLHNCSDMHNDQLSRTCAIIEYLSTDFSNPQNAHANNASALQLAPAGGLQGSATSKRHDLSLVVKSRMSANLVYDAAWRAKDRFSKDIREAKPLDYTFAAEMESLLQFGLDFEGLSPLGLVEEGVEGEFGGWGFGEGL